ncbi:MAG: hypothetical protein ACREDU_10470 [Methylocella sp.]
MKILLDHNLDWRLFRSLPGHEVKSKLKTHISMMQEVNQALLTIEAGQVVEIFHPDMKPKENR